MAKGETHTELDALESQRLEQLQAAQRERQAELKIAAQDAACFYAELIKEAVDPIDARSITEHMMGWYYESNGPWAS